ncbi:MAG: hypothetical protein HN869_06775 [Verrucomicrobia bacterium]|nr:hypothetical protein [Verrucomicrobiota bacterium]
MQPTQDSGGDPRALEVSTEDRDSHLAHTDLSSARANASVPVHLHNSCGRNTSCKPTGAKLGGTASAHHGTSGKTLRTGDAERVRGSLALRRLAHQPDGSTRDCPEAEPPAVPLDHGREPARLHMKQRAKRPSHLRGRGATAAPRQRICRGQRQHAGSPVEPLAGTDVVSCACETDLGGRR